LRKEISVARGSSLPPTASLRPDDEDQPDCVITRWARGWHSCTIKICLLCLTAIVHFRCSLPPAPLLEADLTCGTGESASAAEVLAPARKIPVFAGERAGCARARHKQAWL